jgi:hypothetical protein
MMKPAFTLLIALVVALALEAAGTSPVNAQELATLRGRAVNGTEGATIAPGLPVFLHVFNQQGSGVSSMETTTDDAGGFQFDEVSTTEEAAYAVTMDYAGMRYSTLLGPEDLAAPVELTVYEATQDLSVVEVEHQALVITGINEIDQQIEAVEFVSLVNRSDRTLVPDLSNVRQGAFSFLRFSLPPQATGLDLQSDLMGGEIIPVGTGFAVIAPVAPGEHDISFSFQFPYQGSAFAYQQNLPQGVEVYQVLIPERLGQIQVSGLQSSPPLDVEGSNYRVWEAQDFAPGEGLMVELTNLPQPSLLARLGKSVTDGTFWHITIPATLGAALALVLLYAGFKAPREAPASAMAGGQLQHNGDSRHREALVRAVAALDKKFQQGQMPQSEYEAQRQQLKARLLEAAPPENKGLGQES